MAKISKTAAKERIDFLKRELEKHNYNYYVLNAPTITDFEFDLLMGELQGLEKRFPEFATEDSPSRHVGSDLTSGAAGSDFVQVAHRWPMLSLGNTYAREELLDFDGGQGDSFQRIQNGDGRMGIGGRIDDDAVEFAKSLLNPIDKNAFVIGLADIDG